MDGGEIRKSGELLRPAGVESIGKGWERGVMSSVVSFCARAGVALTGVLDRAKMGVAAGVVAFGVGCSTAPPQHGMLADVGRSPVSDYDTDYEKNNGPTIFGMLLIQLDVANSSVEVSGYSTELTTLVAYVGDGDEKSVHNYHVSTGPFRIDIPVPFSGEGDRIKIHFENGKGGDGQDIMLGGGQLQTLGEGHFKSNEFF